MAVTDKYWESPYYPGGGALVYAGPGSEDFYGATKHAGQQYNFSPDLSYMFAQGGGSGGLGGMFDKLKGKFKGGSGGKFFAPGAGASLKTFGDKLTSPQFSWNKGSGVQGWGMNIGKGLNIANALYQGYGAAKGLGELSDTKDITSDLLAEVMTSSYNNPMLQYDLNSDQLDMLRKIRRGSYDSKAGFDDVDLLGALGAAGKGAIMGIGGGIPGMIIGALGGGANAVIDDINQGQEATNAELEALYQAIMSSEQQYNALKKQRAYANLAGY